jgi:hypothetical protein
MSDGGGLAALDSAESHPALWIGGPSFAIEARATIAALASS